MFRMRPCLSCIITLATVIFYGTVAPPQAEAQIIADGPGPRPVVYQGTILDGVFQTGSVSAAGTFDSPDFAEFYQLFGLQGEEITLSVARTESDLDPALYVYEGLFENTADFGGFFDFADPRFVLFADDELLPATGGTGPFGDPSATFTLTQEGIGAYTVAVVNFASGPNAGPDGRFSFGVQGEGNLLLPTAVPEPSSTIIFATAGLTLLRRRRSGSV